MGDTRPQRTPQHFRLTGHVKEANQDVYGPEDYPGALLHSQKGRSQYDREHTEEADENRARGREDADLGELAGGALAFEMLDDDQRRANRARLDETQQPEAYRQKHQAG